MASTGDPALDWLMANDPDFVYLGPRRYLKRHGIHTPATEEHIAIHEVSAEALNEGSVSAFYRRRARQR